MDNSQDEHNPNVKPQQSMMKIPVYGPPVTNIPSEWIGTPLEGKTADEIAQHLTSKGWEPMNAFIVPVQATSGLVDAMNQQTNTNTKIRRFFGFKRIVGMGAIAMHGTEGEAH